MSNPAAKINATIPDMNGDDRKQRSRMRQRVAAAFDDEQEPGEERLALSRHRGPF